LEALATAPDADADTDTAVDATARQAHERPHPERVLATDVREPVRGPRRASACGPDAPPSAAGPPGPDPDAVIAQLVAQLAPLLGLDPAAIRVRAGAPDARSRGAARTDSVQIADPDRGLVVHELAHVAQHRNRETAALRPDQTRAEAEAAGLQLAQRHGRRLWLPRTALPDGHVARESGATGVAPDTAAANAVEPNDVLRLKAELFRHVEANHKAERERIASELGAVFTTTSAAIESSLALLDTLPFFTARALVLSLPSDVRLRLARLEDSHHGGHPGSAVTVLAALSAYEIIELGRTPDTRPDASPFAGLYSALHGLSAATLNDVQLRAALEVMRAVPEDVTLSLMRGDRREEFRTLVGTAPPPGTDADELNAALAPERRIARAAEALKDGDLLQRLTLQLSARNSVAARAALAELNPVALAVLVDEVFAPLETALTPAFDATAKPATGAASNAPPTASERLRALVSRLDGGGLIDNLLEGLPEEDRYDTEHGGVLRYVLAARNPALNLVRIESLLSYGLFDWRIRDYEARYAYLLVRSLPLAHQEAWRRNDSGKWFKRLQDNIPVEIVTSGEYTGVGTEYVTGLPQGASDSDVSELLTSVLSGWQPHRDTPHAKSAARQLLGLDDATGNPLPSRDKDQPVRVVTVRRLDAMPGIEMNKIVARLPDWYVLQEHGRKELLELSGMRDPQHLELQAATLLSTGIFDWQVNSREAWVAFQLLRALPPADRDRFAAEDKGRWSAMRDALTDEMRDSMAANVLTGRGVFPTHQQLRERLLDMRLWTKEHVPELRAVILLAIHSDDREWVFERSKAIQADRITGLRPLLDDLGLYCRASGRTRYAPEQLETRGRGFELLRFFDDTLKLSWILVAIGTLLTVETSLAGYSIGVGDFNLAWAQWAMGGNIAGARLAADGPKSTAPGTLDSMPEVQSNRLSVSAELATGAVRLLLPKLRLESTNFMLGGASYRSGRVELDNLSIKGSFSDRGYKTPIGVEVEASRLDVRDLVLADPRLLSGAWALAHILLGGDPLHLKSGALGNEDLAGIEPSEGTIPFPLLGPLFQMLRNIVAIKGGIPGNYSVLDFAMMPFTGGMSLVASVPLGMAANALVPTPVPGDLLWGLATDGVLRPPRTVLARIEDAQAMLRSLEVDFKTLQIQGLSIGAGQQIAGITLTDVHIGLAASKPAYLRLQIASLKRASREGLTPADVAALDVSIAALEEQLKGVIVRDPRSKSQLPTRLEGMEDRERRLEELERKDRWVPGSLTPSERVELTALSDELRMDAGMILDIGSITVGPLSGRIESGGLVLTGIHADAHGPIGQRRYLADEELIARMRAGGPVPLSAAEAARRSEGHLRIDSTRLLASPTGGPALSIAAARLPTATELRATLAELGSRADPRVRSRVERALALVMENDAIRAAQDGVPGVVRSAGAIEDERQRIILNEDAARRLLGIEIEELSIGAITGELDPAAGTFSAKIHDVDAGGISAPGFVAARAHGDLEAGVAGIGTLTGDLRTTGAKQLRRGLKAHAGLDLTVDDVGTAYGTVGKILIAGLRGDIEELDDGVRVSNVVADRLQLDKVELGTAEAGISAITVALEGVRLDARTFTTAGNLTGAVVTSLDITRLSATELVFDGRKADGTGLRVELHSGALLGIHAEGVKLDHNSEGWKPVQAAASIAGVQDARYDLLIGSLTGGARRETRIGGTLAGGSAKPPPGVDAVISAKFATVGGRSFELAVSNLDALDTTVITPQGSVLLRRAGISTTLKEEKGVLSATAHLGDINIKHVNWRAGGLQITADGAIVLHSVDVKARIEPAEPDSKDLERRVPRLHIDDLDINGISADDLHLVDAPLDLHLGRDKTGHPDALKIKRIQLQRFTLPMLEDGSPGAHITSGHLAISELHADFAGTLKRGVTLSGDLNADTISVDMSRGDRFVARARGLGVRLVVDAVGDDAGITRGTVAFKGVDTGNLSVSPDALVLEGLRMPLITLDALKVKNTGSLPFDLVTDPKGSVAVVNLDVAARIERWRPGEAHPATQPFRRIVLERFKIERIDVEGLQLTLPSVVITVPMLAAGGMGAPQLASLRGIVLEGPKDAPGEGFVIVPGSSELLRGVARLDETIVPRLTAAVARTLKGEVKLTTAAASIAFLERGKTIIDIAQPLLSMANAATLGSPDRTIRIEGIGAKSIHVEGGVVSVTGAAISNVTYKQPGITVVIPNIDAAALTASAAGGEIPDIDIAGAHITLDLAELEKQKIMSVESTAKLDLDLDNLIDSAQGTVSLKVFLRAFNITAFDDQDIEIPVMMNITDGRVNYLELERSLAGKIRSHDADETDDPSGIINWGASEPKFRQYGNDVYLKVHLFMVYGLGPPFPLDIELLHWQLPPAELKRYTTEQLMRLGRFMQLAPGKPAKPGDTGVDMIEVRDLSVDLSLKSTNKIVTKFTSNGASGTIVYAPDAIKNLTAKGDIISPIRPTAPRPALPATAGLRDIGLVELNIESVALHIGGTQVDTMAIQITGMKGATLSFHGYEPQLLDAKITKATAHNVRWILAKD
jgi:hypothetical protein